MVVVVVCVCWCGAWSDTLKKTCVHPKLRVPATCKNGTHGHVLNVYTVGSSSVLLTKICPRRVVTCLRCSPQETFGSYPFKVWEQVEHNTFPIPPIIRYTVSAEKISEFKHTRPEKSNSNHVNNWINGQILNFRRKNGGIIRPRGFVFFETFWANLSGGFQDSQTFFKNIIFSLTSISLHFLFHFPFHLLSSFSSCLFFSLSSSLFFILSLLLIFSALVLSRLSSFIFSCLLVLSPLLLSLFLCLLSLSFSLCLSLSPSPCDVVCYVVWCGSLWSWCVFGVCVSVSVCVCVFVCVVERWKTWKNRVYVRNVPVCTGTTRTCVSTGGKGSSSVLLTMRRSTYGYHVLQRFTKETFGSFPFQVWD